MLFKILNGLICVHIDNYLTLPMSNTSGNVCKLVKYYSRLDIRKYFVAFGVIDIWKSLPDDIICCTNGKQFIYILKTTDLSHFLKLGALKAERVNLYRSTFTCLIFICRPIVCPAFFA